MSPRFNRRGRALARIRRRNARRRLARVWVEQVRQVLKAPQMRALLTADALVQLAIARLNAQAGMVDPATGVVLGRVIPESIEVMHDAEGTVHVSCRREAFLRGVTITGTVSL